MREVWNVIRAIGRAAWPDIKMLFIIIALLMPLALLMSGALVMR